MDKFVNEYVTVIVNWVSNYSIKVVAAILVLVIGNWLSHRISNLLKTLLEKNKIDITLVGFLSNIIYYALMIMVVIAAAGQLGINTTSFLTIVGAAGLAVGLALKDSLSNFAAGVMLILFRPFKVNDTVNAGGITGKVESINIFNTVLNTVDNQRVIIPNNSITSAVITNVTANTTRRVDLVVGISYKDNIAFAKETVMAILEADSRILKDPVPVVAVAELAASCVNLAVRPWVKTGDYGNVLFDLNETIKTTFDEKGISIPFPQQEIHIIRSSGDNQTL
jgi:small conductance mechanosensitive channel